MINPMRLIINGWLFLLMITMINSAKAQNVIQDKYEVRDNTTVNRALLIFNEEYVLITKNSYNLQKLLSEHLNSISTFNASNCQKIGTKLYNEFYNIRPEEYIIADIINNAESLVLNAFKVLIHLKEKYNAIPANHLNDDCVDSTRKAFLALRSFGDYVGFISNLKIPAKGLDMPQGTLYNSNLNVQGLALKSGDVIVSRGNAYSSATISRITDVVTQFSHLAILYIDPNSKKKFIIEAHIEQGTIVTTWEKYINDGKIRALVLRQKNEQLAHESAKAIYDHVLGYKKNNNKNIPYDFGMNLDDSNEFFCSEVVHHAYKLGSENMNGSQFIIPQFLSKSTSRNVIKESLGISNVNSFFSPIDLEVDTRFEIIAEFKNYSVMNQAWGKDAVLTFLFEKWNNNEITLNSTVPSEALTKLATYLRTNTKWGRENLVEKVPDNGPYKGVRMMIILNIFMSKDFDEWIEKANKFRESKKLPAMNYSQTLRYIYDYQGDFIEEFSKYLEKN